jgi:hypothetical protein
MATVRVYLGGGIGPVDIPLPPGVGTAAYAALKISSNVTATSMPTQNVPATIVAGWAQQNGVPPQGATVNAGAGSITVTAAGIYLVAVNLSLNTPNNANDRFAASVSRNGGGAQDGLKSTLKMDLTTDYTSTSFSALMACAAGDVLTVQIADQQSAAASIVVSDAGFSVLQVA